MVLCRNCAHFARVTMLNCPRCGFALPYWRSRRWRVRWNPAGMAAGRACPNCDQPTRRRHSPLWAKPLRLLLGERCSYRHCHGCGWHGVAFHSPAPHARSPK